MSEPMKSARGRRPRTRGRRCHRQSASGSGGPPNLRGGVVDDDGSPVDFGHLTLEDVVNSRSAWGYCSVPNRAKIVRRRKRSGIDTDLERMRAANNILTSLTTLISKSCRPAATAERKSCARIHSPARDNHVVTERKLHVRGAQAARNSTN
jgi:hypothetical protein